MRGTASEMNRSRNSYIRAPRSVTEQPTGMPARSPKFAIDFFALVTTGFWPVTAASSSTRRVELLRVLARVTHADVQHDLAELRHLVRVRQRE